MKHGKDFNLSQNFKLEHLISSCPHASRQINKDLVYNEAPLYACVFLNDVNSFLKRFLKKIGLLVQIHLTENISYYGMVIF